jgi:hypothetical protein
VRAPNKARRRASPEGEWVERPDGVRLVLFPAYYDIPERTWLALQLALSASDPDVSEAQVAAWTSEQRRAAAEWAISVHYSAADNEDVIVPARPVFLGGSQP